MLFALQNNATNYYLCITGGLAQKHTHTQKHSCSLTLALIHSNTRERQAEVLLFFLWVKVLGNVRNSSRAGFVSCINMTMHGECFVAQNVRLHTSVISDFCDFCDLLFGGDNTPNTFSFLQIFFPLSYVLSPSSVSPLMNNTTFLTPLFFGDGRLVGFA